MSRFHCPEPTKSESNQPNEVELVILPRTVDIGNFTVHRALPFQDKRMVGPFIFWDQMGPGELLAGQGVDVRPHPHIGLSTVTYLFDGSLDHKDSLGCAVRILPGDVNLMTAGAGIVHSERTGQDVRQNNSKLFGIQSWMALPLGKEEIAPDFTHFDKNVLPTFKDKGITGRVILGQLEGLSSPVALHWETIYVELNIEKGRCVVFEKAVEERAIYVLKGSIDISGAHFFHEQMVVLRPGAQVQLKATSQTHLLFLGGAAMDGPRLIWWNFVSSSAERLEQAKLDWTNKKFASIPGDNEEFIPLPNK